MVKELRLEFLLELFQNGIEIGDERKQLLRTAGLIKDFDENQEGYTPSPKYVQQKQRFRKPVRERTVKSEEAIEADKHVDVVSEDTELPEFIGEDEYKTYDYSYRGGSEITRADWMPEDLMNHSSDFVAWIDSINQSFRFRKNYTKFNLYIQQANDWLAQKSSFHDFDSEDDRIDYALHEFRKIRENTLYFLNKYLMYKEDVTGTSITGQYKSQPANEVVAYLIDCGYSLMIGKARQIWFTTTMGGIAIKKANFNKNHFGKYICENLKKGQEIFDDKIKYAFYHLPDWMKGSVNNDQELMIKFLFKSPSNKGNIIGADSKLIVEAPYITAINGGSPTIIWIDEIGQIPILGKIIQEGRPTLYHYDPTTGKMVWKRQVIAWGTGGEVERGGAEFEQEFNDTMNAWKNRNFTYGIIPLFFDAWARAGFNMSIYEKEKALAYASGDESKRVKFHQHFPLSMQDMFLSSKETIIPVGEIQTEIERIVDKKVNSNNKPRYGYFEPVYDLTSKMPEGSYIPYKLIGATFVPTEDGQFSPEAAVCIIDEPDLEYADRYFQGTDPINSAGGTSNFSSSIWDSLFNRTAAALNHRSTDYRFDYLQCALMNIYYGRPMHLIEINIGTELVNFLDALGLYRTLVPQSMLPPPLQLNTSEVIGISKKSANTDRIINRLVDMLSAYRKNIDVEEFWIQLKTFVRKESKTSSTLNGEVRAIYKTENHKYWKDDLIYGILYAYICAQCYSFREPYKKEQVKKKARNVLVCNADTGWENTVVRVSK